jgi:hypothetical protein
VSEPADRSRDEREARLYRRFAWWSFFAGALFGLLLRLVRGDFVTPVRERGGMFDWQARLGRAIEEWPGTLASTLFWGLISVAISRVFAGVWSVLSDAYPSPPSPSPTPTTPTAPGRSEQITDRPGTAAISKPADAECSTRITSRPDSPQTRIVKRDALGSLVPPIAEAADLRRQLRLCLLTSVTIAVTAYICAWLTWGSFDNFVSSQSLTRRDLRQLDEQIVRYRERTGHLPASLLELGEDENKQIRRDEDGWPLDGWWQPFHYVLIGNSYDLYSLGKDGAPGGSGLDADLHADRSDPWNEWITLWQFTKLANGGIMLTCIVAGVIAFPICLFGSNTTVSTRMAPSATVLRCVLTAIFAVLTAVVISALHLSGH